MVYIYPDYLPFLYTFIHDISRFILVPFLFYLKNCVWHFFYSMSAGNEFFVFVGACTYFALISERIFLLDIKFWILQFFISAFKGFDTESLALIILQRNPQSFKLLFPYIKCIISVRSQSFQPLVSSNLIWVGFVFCLFLSCLVFAVLLKSVNLCPSPIFLQLFLQIFFCNIFSPSSGPEVTWILHLLKLSPTGP